jgi:hypothetical protein
MGLLDDAIREHLDLKRRRGADPTEIEKAERDALGPVRRDATSTALSEAEPRVADTPGPASQEFDFDLASTTAEHAGDITGDEATMIAAPVSPIANEVDQAPAGIVAPAYDEPDSVGPAYDDFAATEASSADVPAPPADFDLPSERPIEAPEPRHKRRHLFGRHRHDHDQDFAPEPGTSAELPVDLPDDDPFLDDPVSEAPRETTLGEAVGSAEPAQRDEAARHQPPVAEPPALKITPEAELGHTMEYDVEQAFAEEDEADEDILEETPDFLSDTPDHDRLWFEQKPPPDFDFDN